jgi:hypothetical protein
LVRKSAPPTAHPDIVHRVNIANHLVAVLRDALASFRRCLIDLRDADSASLSSEHPDRQSAGATADERREPFHGGCGNRFCRSEPLHADVQEGHWSYTTRVASESDPKTLLASIVRLMSRSRLERSRVCTESHELGSLAASVSRRGLTARS